MNLPLVSILTAYYNRQDYVTDSILSLLNQSYQNLEIIIINDNSTDQTYERIIQTVNGDPRVKLINNELNKGLTQSFIDAIKIAQGDYIAIHGSGDYSFPTRIEQQIRFLLNNEGYDIVSCRRFNEKNSQKHLYDPYYGDITYDMLVRKNRYSHGEVMFRKTLYNKIGGYNPFYKYAQDIDLWLRMHKYSKGYILKEVLYLRRYIENSVSLNLEKKKEQIILSSFAVYSSDYNVPANQDNIRNFKSNKLAYKLFKKSVRNMSFPFLKESLKRIKLTKPN
ncbi:glycosyltransferase [Litoribacter alkaliphilus]|uniref:Glycosyltransferase n=1 Tax=Litoribacter ruber TaxID=702568 RepID=A0AAP2CJG6_9BACT|nr:glycosyltransferase [Litoribacter alkaliphilus]MBS9525883.1 glycosyltransferase [Litoribacter alkaliphilus]